MIGLDTNVLVRFLAQDHEAQAGAATRAIEAFTKEEPGFISLVTLAEVAWALKSVHRLPKDEILPIIDAMLGTEEFRFERADVVRRAVRAARLSSADFVDALINALGVAAGCDTTLTFDRAAAELDGMTLLDAR